MRRPIRNGLATAAAALVLAAALTVCLGASRPQPAAPKGAVASAPEPGPEVVCRVDTRDRRGPVPRGLFGTNLEWFNNANGLWVEGQGLDQRFTALAQDQGISVVRFPGGTFSDFYHWQDGIGDRKRRPVRPHFTDPGQSPNPFGTVELLQFCQKIGALPLLTVNVGSGTPQEAATWVRFCNGPDNPLAATPEPQPRVKVPYWEIGNELYLAGSDAERKISLRPAAYAERFLQYAAAMRRIDPQIALLAPAVAESYRVPFGAYRDWTQTLLQKAAGEIDYLAVHNAYFPVLLDNRELPARTVYQALWAAPEAVDQGLGKLEKLIDRYRGTRDIGIAVTEWGPFFSLGDPAWVDQVKTLGSAVYVARMLQVFLQHPKVRLANYFKFADATFLGWVSFRHEPKAPYFALQLMARHFGTELVTASIGSDTFDSREVGLVPALKRVPELTVVAALGDAGNKLYVNIVNRSWATTYPVRLDLQGFAAAPQQSRMYLLSGASPLANNGPDLPKNWPWPFREPAARAPGGIGIATRSYDSGQPCAVPPHSVVTLELTRSPAREKGRTHD